MNEPKFTGMAVSEARVFVAANRKKGCDCPVCDQYVREYGRSIHTSMALVLIALHKRFDANDALEWLHVSRFPRAPRFNINGDYNYLRHWGLLQPHPEWTGYWRVTELGHQFVRGEVRVPKRVFLLNNERVGASDQTISIWDALGNGFDYTALMTGAA